MIIAKQEILYEGKTYKPGEALPETDLFQVGRWLSAGSAHRVEPKRKPKEPAEPQKPEGTAPVTQGSPPAGLGTLPEDQTVPVREAPVAKAEDTQEKPPKKQAKDKTQEAVKDGKPAEEGKG